MEKTSNSLNIAEIKALAQQGDADAQYKLGWALCCGDTAEEDFDCAMYWFLQAALQGHPKGLWKVGNRFEEDDPKQAISIAMMTKIVHAIVNRFSFSSFFCFCRCSSISGAFISALMEAALTTGIFCWVVGTLEIGGTSLS